MIVVVPICIIDHDPPQEAPALGCNAKGLREDEHFHRTPRFFVHFVRLAVAAIMRTPMIKFRYVKGMYPVLIPL